MHFITLSILIISFLDSAMSGGPTCESGKHTLHRDECLYELDKLLSCQGKWALQIYLGQLQILDLTEPPAVWTEVILTDPEICRDTSLCVTKNGVLQLFNCGALVKNWGLDVSYVKIDDNGTTFLIDSSDDLVLSLPPIKTEWVK